MDSMKSTLSVRTGSRGDTGEAEFMTRTRLVLCLGLIGALGACGGRSGLHVASGDGGPAADGNAAGRFDGGTQPALLDGNPGTQMGTEVGSPDSRSGGGTPDVRAEADGPATARDVPSADANRAEAATAIDGSRDVSVGTGPTLSSIEISPPNPTVNVGVPLSVVITAVYSDGSTKDVSSSSTVTSGSTSILTVSGATLSGVKAGTATITASYQGKTATATVTVVATALQSISIQAVAPVPIGQTVNLVATGVFADGSKQDVTAQATWISSSAAIATVGNAATTKGQVTGVSAGTVTVTATIQTVSGTVQVAVVAKQVSSIQITPTQPILQRGVTQQFMATAVYDDNSTGDVTQQATWSTGDATVLTVVASGATAGLATAVAAGTTSITATLGTITGTTPVTVTSPTLTSITVSPATATIVVGGTNSFTAQGSYADGSTADLTNSVTWSSGDTTVLSLSNATGTRGQATALALGTANVQAALSGVTGTAAVTVTAPRLVSIAVTPNPASVPVGVSLSLAATATYADQSTQDVTATATWTVANSAIATVGNVGSAAGQVTGVKVGSTTVTATLSGVSGSATVTVANPSLVSITVAPAAATVSAGNTQAFTATANYDNSTTLDITTQATWSSSNIAVAQVSNAAGSNGLATSLTAGTATITATYSGVQGTATLTVTAPALVSIMVTPATATIAAGTTQAYRVTGVYQNGTTTTTLTGVTWSSSLTGVATIVVGGTDGGFPGAPAAAATATGVSAGTTTITATYTSGTTTLSDSATLTVTNPVTPTGINLTPATATINVGASQTYTVVLENSDGSTTAVTTGVTLTTSDGTVAAVAALGGGRGGFGGLSVTGAGAGTATITATYTTGGQTFTATASITVTVPATQVGLYITPATASVQVNGTQQFAAYATYSDGTSTAVTNNANCSWTTSDGTLATVTTAGGAGGRGAIGGGGAGGLATGVAAGNVTVNATFGGFSATATLTITAPLTQVGLYITPATASVRVGGTQQFAAYATYSDGTSTAVTNNANCVWSTSDGTLASITTAGAGGGRGAIGGGGTGGLATGLAVGDAGSVTIGAAYGGFSATAALTVTAPVLTSLAITPATATILVGQTQAFVATAVYDDGSTANVTTTATWTSSDATVAVMSTAGGGRGGFGGVVGGATATGLAVGTATIGASYTENGVTETATAALTVNNPPLLSIEITPTDPTVSLLSPSQAFVATAIYTDYSTANVTTSASWSSSSGTVAVISNSGATTGRATGLTAGTTIITATYNGMSASTTLTVVSKKVTTVQVTPTNPTAVLGIGQAFVATAIYDDNSTGVVTTSATWTSSDTTVASIGTTGGTAGVATPIAAGSATITATYQGVSGTTLLTVSGATLISIAITPSPLSVAVGGHQQLTATGTWGGDASVVTLDITNNVTWLSSSDGTATVSNAAGSRGLLTAVSAGPITVTAAFQGVTGTLAGTVTASH